MFEIIQSLISGIFIGFYAFLKALPIYEQLSSIKEQLISAATKIPVIVISIISFISAALAFLKKASKR